MALSKPFPGPSKQCIIDIWRETVRSLYPDLLHKTICVPPVHFNQESFVRRTVPGTGLSALQVHKPTADQPVHDDPSASQQPEPSTNFQSSLWTQESEPHATPVRVQCSDFVDDAAQQHVLNHLEKLGNDHGEVMFILSQLNFTSYLNSLSYAAAADSFPLAIDLGRQYCDGEVDILLFHRRYGILVGELKAVGKQQKQLKDSYVIKKVREAVKQLNNAGKAVKHLLSDIVPQLTVRKTILLPYVSRSQLQRALDAAPQLKIEVCRTLGEAKGQDATQLCVCSDDLSDPATFQDNTPPAMSQLKTWWQQRMAFAEDLLLNDDLYVDIVARFAGPATTVSLHCTVPPRVEVRTKGEAVSELGRRLARLVLTLQQLGLLSTALPLVCITGPPGTGKTTCLVLMGLRWLRQGKDVHVVCVRNRTLAISNVIEHQLQTTLVAEPTASAPPGRIILHTYDIYFSDEREVDRAITELSEASHGQELYVLLDEVNFSEKKGGPRCQELVRELTRRVSDLHLWTAAVVHTHIPKELQKERLTFPLRSAPVVIREIEQGVQRYSKTIDKYSGEGIPFPADGLHVVRLSHDGNGHWGQWPVECFECGKKVAAELRCLGVGTDGTNLPNSPAPLQYRDVFILTRSSELQDDLTTSPASGFVRGLRDAGLPVAVLGVHDWRLHQEKWKNDAEDIAVARTNQVTAAHFSVVSGLERKVVVWLPGRWQGVDDSYGYELIDSYDRLYGWSRGTTQLVVVDVPGGS